MTLKSLLLICLISLSLLYPTPIASSTLTSRPDYSPICLAQTIYYEARGEPLKGQLAVAKVVLNRAKQSKGKYSICDIVYLPNQFTWTKYKYKRLYDNTSLNVANLVLKDKYILKDFDATYFNRSKHLKLTHVAQIGQHTFYK